MEQPTVAKFSAGSKALLSHVVSKVLPKLKLAPAGKRASVETTQTLSGGAAIVKGCDVGKTYYYGAAAVSQHITAERAKFLGTAPYYIPDSAEARARATIEEFGPSDRSLENAVAHFHHGDARILVLAPELFAEDRRRLSLDPRFATARSQASRASTSSASTRSGPWRRKMTTGRRPMGTGPTTSAAGATTRATRDATSERATTRATRDATSEICRTSSAHWLRLRSAGDPLPWTPRPPRARWRRRGRRRARWRRRGRRRLRPRTSAGGSTSRHGSATRSSRRASCRSTPALGGSPDTPPPGRMVYDIVGGAC